jgi:pimeloyl-ACP methyl ester carboxylesterase
MRTVLLAILLLLGVAGVAHAATDPPQLPGDSTRTLLIGYRAHDGRVRSAWLLLPASYHGQPIPLVISPHGRGIDPFSNALRWGDLPGEGGFAVVNPAGPGRRLGAYSWGDPGQIDDLARMPAIVRAHGVNVDPRRVYAVGGSMGGQETLLLVARFPRLLAGAIAFDPATDMIRRYWDFADLKHGARLQTLAREEVGGTPATDPRGYDVRSPDRYARAIAGSGVPLQVFWSSRDRIIVDQRAESAALASLVHGLNPRERLWDFGGQWAHTAEMKPTGRLPRALARFGLLPWSDVPPEPAPARPALERDL